MPEGFTLLQITPRLEGGGVEQVTLDTALAVVRAGRRSIVASAGGRLEAALIAGGAESWRLPLESRNPLVMADNARRLARLIRNERVSLIHVRSRAPAFSALHAGSVTGIPVVTTYHGIYQARSPLKRWYNGVMTRGTATIANSAYTRDHIVAEHGLPAEHITLVPEGIDTDVFDPGRVAPERVAAARSAWGVGPDDPRPVMLLAARLTGWKGHRVMIEALGRLNGPDAPLLVLAGGERKPSEADSLRDAASRAGVSDSMKLVGPLGDMPAAYLAADLVVAPSTLPESFGRSVVEASAMGRCVVASTLGGPGETVVHGETGWLAPPGDPEIWARAVADALATPVEVRRRMGEAARRRVAALYSLDAMAVATFALYRRLLKGRP